MKEIIESYIKRVRELAEHVRGNEQATKQSLIGPLFTLLGYDLTDPASASLNTRRTSARIARSSPSIGRSTRTGVRFSSSRQKRPTASWPAMTNSLGTTSESASK